MSRTEIDAVCPQLRVVHLSELKAIGKITILCPLRRAGRGAAKKSRASARNMMRLQAPLFSPFFSGKTEKNGPPEAQLRYYRILPHAGACQQPLRQNLRFCHLPLHRGGFGRTESSAPTRTATNALRLCLRAFVISFAPAKWDAAASDTARANSRHPAPDVSRCRACAGSYGACASPPG